MLYGKMVTRDQRKKPVYKVYYFDERMTAHFVGEFYFFQAYQRVAELLNKYIYVGCLGPADKMIVFKQAI